MCVIHCEIQEFCELLIQQRLKAFVRPYVLDTHIAGVVYMTKDVYGDLYYCDRFYVSDKKQKEYSKIPFFEAHSELYRKIALDEYLRNQTLN